MSRDAQQQPPFSISQVSTLTASFADDVRAYAEAGVGGIGVWEIKLGDGSLDEFRASGLGSATAVPAVPSVHPLPLLAGPDTVRERVDALLRSLEILAPYEPPAILCFTGPGDRETAVRGVREVAREAERLGLRLAVEPFQLEGIESWSILNTLGDAAEFVDEVGSDAVGIQFDVWHLWNTADVLDEIPRYAQQRQHDTWLGVAEPSADSMSSATIPSRNPAAAITSGRAPRGDLESGHRQH